MSETPETKIPDTPETKTPKRIRTKYQATVNRAALKELENTTVASFTELANKVILIDNMPFSEAKYKDTSGAERPYKLTTGRKADFIRLIEHYAVIQFVGIKCHVAKVFEDTEKREIDNIYLQKHKNKVKNT